MATHKLNDALVVIGTTTLSGLVKGLDYGRKINPLDDTRMGHVSKANIAGLENSPVDIDFAQDYANSQVDQTLNPLVGTPVALEIRPTSAAAGTANPKWTGTMLLTEYKPIGAQVGEYHMTRAHFEPYGGTGLARGTS